MSGVLPTVDICIPTYNGAAFLAEAIESAIAQTYPHCTILVCDDGSADATLDVARSYAARSPFPLHVVAHARLGIAANWNACLDCTTGDYIKFLCQDDRLEPECVAQLVAAIARDGEIGMAFCRRRLLYGGELPADLAWLQAIHEAWPDLKPVQWGCDLLADRALLVPPDNKIGEPTNVLLSRRAIASVGAFDPAFGQYCDLDMWWRVMARWKIAFVDAELASFRIHPQQASQENQRRDRVWAEIYALWLKVLTDPVFQPVPLPARRRLYRHLWQTLGREAVKSALWGRWHRLPRIAQLCAQVLRAGRTMR